MSTIESIVSNWHGIEVGSHRFNAREFTLEEREIGHIHSEQLLDISFTKRIHDILIENGRAEKHHIHPDSNWISYPIDSDSGSDSDEAIDGALWLLRISYLYHLITLRKRETGADMDAVDIDIDAELAELDVSPELENVFNEVRTA